MSHNISGVTLVSGSKQIAVEHIRVLDISDLCDLRTALAGLVMGSVILVDQDNRCTADTVDEIVGDDAICILVRFRGTTQYEIVVTKDERFEKGELFTMKSTRR